MNSRIIPIFALFLAVGTFFIYVSPQWTGPIKQAKEGIKNDTDALAAAREFTARQNELAAQKDAIDPTQLGRLESFLPDSVDNVGLILDLNALAARAGLALSNINVANADASGATVEDAAPVGSVDMTVTAIGTYDSLQNFLQGVEHSLRVLDEENITIKGSDTGVYTYTMRIRIYWLR